MGRRLEVSKPARVSRYEKDPRRGAPPRVFKCMSEMSEARHPTGSWVILISPNEVSSRFKGQLGRPGERTVGVGARPNCMRDIKVPMPLRTLDHYVLFH
ncbi:unnamed protein product, partial [Iphiclides podalirius]